MSVTENTTTRPADASPEQVQQYRAELAREQRYGLGLVAAIGALIPALVLWRFVFRWVGYDTSRPEIWCISATLSAALGVTAGVPFKKVGRGVGFDFALTAFVLGSLGVLCGDFLSSVSQLSQLTSSNLAEFASQRGYGDLILYAIAGGTAAHFSREVLTNDAIHARLQRRASPPAGPIILDGEGAPTVRIRFARMRALLTPDTWLEVSLDGHVVYEGSFLRGFDVSVVAAPGSHTLRVALRKGEGHHERVYDILVPATGYRGGAPLEVVLRYGRFRGTFAQEIETHS